MSNPRKELAGIKLDKRFEEYLTLKKKSTQEVYRGAFKHFTIFYHGKYGQDKNIEHFLQRIIDNNKKDILEREKMLIEHELMEYIECLKEKGKANNSIRSYIGGMQNFLKYYNIAVSSRFIGNMPPSASQKKNHKHEWKIDQIKSFVDVAPTYRDKAIILCLFQSGLSISDLLALNYEDIKDEYEKNILPIHLQLNRKKTGVEFKTFFGRDAVKYLRLYLGTRKELNDSSPLFTKWNSDTERLSSGGVEMKFREIVKKLDFITNNGGGFNPARPHSLRSAFTSLLTNKIDRLLIEFWSGHAIGGSQEPYLNLPTDEMREIYMDAERYLAIERTSRDEIIEQKEKQVKIPKETLEEIENLKTTISTLTKEYSALKRRMDYFSKSMELTPEEYRALSDMIRDYINKRQIEADRESLENERKERERLMHDKDFMENLQSRSND